MSGIYSSPLPSGYVSDILLIPHSELRALPSNSPNSTEADLLLLQPEAIPLAVEAPLHSSRVNQMASTDELFTLDFWLYRYGGALQAKLPQLMAEPLIVLFRYQRGGEYYCAGLQGDIRLQALGGKGQGQYSGLAGYRFKLNGFCAALPVQISPKVVQRLMGLPPLVLGIEQNSADGIGAKEWEIFGQRLPGLMEVWWGGRCLTFRYAGQYNERLLVTIPAGPLTASLPLEIRYRQSGRVQTEVFYQRL